jgi:hypothetical protein
MVSSYNKMTDAAHNPEVPISAVLTVNADAVPGLAKEIARLAEGFSNENPANRMEMLEKVRALQLALETPRDTMIRHLWAEVSSCPAPKTFHHDPPTQTTGWIKSTAKTPDPIDCF